MALRSVMLAAAAVIPAMIATLHQGPSPASAHTGCNQPWDRPDGMYIQPQGSASQYLVEHCQKRHFQHPLDVQSYNFGYPVRIVSDEEAAAMQPGPNIRAREGTIFRKSNGDIYIIDTNSTGGWFKRYIDANGWSAFFSSCGYNSSHWIQLSAQNDSYLNSYSNGPTVTGNFPRPDGQLIKAPGSAAIYIIETSGTGAAKRHFPTPGDLSSHNLNRPVCTISGAGNYYDGPQIRAREGTLFKGSLSAQYVVDLSPSGYRKRLVTSTQSLTFYGLNGVPLQNWLDSDVNSYPDHPNHVHPVKTTFSYAWNRNLATSSLGYGVTYNPGTTAGSWDSAITAARDSWNGGPIAPRFYRLTYGPYDVDIIVDDYGFTNWSGDAQPIFDSQGKVQTYRVRLDWSDFPSGSQHVIAHELGHVLLLDHDGMTNGGFDWECGGYRVPVTIMDYDCAYSVMPTNWDFCGVNHKHPSSYGIAGC